MVPTVRRHLVEFADSLDKHRATLPHGGRLTLSGPGSTSLASWFLGPKAENGELLCKLIQEAVESHCDFRKRYFPTDPVYLTEDIRHSDSYRNSVSRLEAEFRVLLENMQDSVPFFSYRYLGHMNWDTTLPAILGFFTALLYNPNNVAAESSPVTTLFEMAVGDDLCRMLGYTVPVTDEIDPGILRPWGHITCDGSVANLEAMWACRNQKLYPVALAAAIRSEASLSSALNLVITTPSGEPVRLLDAEPWTIMNLSADEVLSLTGRLDQHFGIDNTTLTSALLRYSVQNLGLLDVYYRFLPSSIATPVIFAPATMHYSWPKGAAILGLGANTVVTGIVGSPITS